MPVFSLRSPRARLPLAAGDAVAAAGAAAGAVWLGTRGGALLRQRGGAVARLLRPLPSAVACVFANPYDATAALVVLADADVYYVVGDPALSARWLAALRGMRCVAAAWVRVPAAALASERGGGDGGGGGGGGDGEEGSVVVALLGTAFGSVFLLTLGERREAVRKVWAAPSGEHVDGLRVERVAGNFVASVATASALYTLHGVATLDDLFSSEHGDAVHRAGDLASDAGDVNGGGGGGGQRSQHFEAPLPSELQFMTAAAGGGGASRRFVWAAHGGILHAQLALRSRRAARDGAGAAITANITEKTVFSWPALKEESGSAVPMACNLSTFHTLVLYPGSVYAFNQISGELTEVLQVWNPGTRAGTGRGHGVAGTDSWDVVESEADGDGGDAVDAYLASPAAGFVRDAAVDALWVYTEDGQLGLLESSDEEQRVAWRAAKAVGRFDLAMALAPFVGDSEAGAVDFARSREAVFEAQGDHAASNGDWDSAARLYAKTERPIETVLLDIVEACTRANASDGAGDTGPSAKLGHVLTMKDEDGSGEGHRITDNAADDEEESIGNEQMLEPNTHGRSRASMTMAAKAPEGVGGSAACAASRLMITYLVSKLDTISEKQPSQRTIVATILVQLYASCLSRRPIQGEDDSELRLDFGRFLADHAKDMHVPTAVSILNSHRCYNEARKVCELSGDFMRAADVAMKHETVEMALGLVFSPVLAKKPKDAADVLALLSDSIASRGPRQLAETWAKVARAGNAHLDHGKLLVTLAHVARAHSDISRRNAAYKAAVWYVEKVLCSISSAAEPLFSAATSSSSLASSAPGMSSEAMSTVGAATRCEFPALNGNDSLAGENVKKSDAARSKITTAALARSSCADLSLGELEALSPEWHSAVRTLFSLHAECGHATAAERSYALIIEEHEMVADEEMRATLADILQSGYRGKFWNLLASVYGALGLHEEAVALALEHSPGDDTSAAEAHVSSWSALQDTPAAQALWAQIAASARDDVLGVASRSGGVLRVDDALPLMPGFSRAAPDVTAAVAASLADHQDAAARASEDARHTLERTAAMRRDLAAVAAWQATSRRAPCGHRAPLGAACTWCGADAIALLDAPLL